MRISLGRVVGYMSLQFLEDVMVTLAEKDEVSHGRQFPTVIIFKRNRLSILVKIILE